MKTVATFRGSLHTVRLKMRRNGVPIIVRTMTRGGRNIGATDWHGVNEAGRESPNEAARRGYVPSPDHRAAMWADAKARFIRDIQETI